MPRTRCDCGAPLVHGACPTCDRLKAPHKRAAMTTRRERARRDAAVQREARVYTNAKGGEHVPPATWDLRRAAFAPRR